MVLISLKVLWLLALRLVYQSTLEGLGTGEMILFHFYNLKAYWDYEGITGLYQVLYMKIRSLFHVVLVKGFVDPRFVVHALCAYTTGIYV